VTVRRARFRRDGRGADQPVWLADSELSALSSVALLIPWGDNQAVSIAALILHVAFIGCFDGFSFRD
jgi:hypothetical protein